MMATRKRTEDSPVSRRPDVEAEMTDQYHVKWSFIRDVGFAQFDQDQSIHNQARFEPLDEKTVDAYAEAAERGDTFPAVIAWRPTKAGKLIIIDGNHRLASHARVGRALDVYEVDAGTDPRTVALMTFAFNTKHGRPTTEVERVSQAMYLVDNGATIDAAAAAVNIPARIVRRSLNKQTADRRADEVGLLRREWDSIPFTSKSRLANLATDEGFKAAAELTFAAKLNATEVAELVALLNATRSGTRQRAIVDGQRDHFADRIQAGAGGLLTADHKRAATPKRRVALALGQVSAFPGDDAVIVGAYAATEREAAARRMREAGDRLLRLAEAMERP